MKSLFAVLAMSVAVSFNASAEDEFYWAEISGKHVFEDQSINQMDDSSHPPQGFKIEIPANFGLAYSATPDDGNGRKCSVKKVGRVILVEAKNLETDEGGCYAFLIFRNHVTGGQKTVSYYIEQTGT